MEYKCSKGINFITFQKDKFKDVCNMRYLLITKTNIVKHRLWLPVPADVQ